MYAVYTFCQWYREPVDAVVHTARWANWVPKLNDYNMSDKQDIAIRCVGGCVKG